MLKNVRRWKFELAILHLNQELSVEDVLEYADPGMVLRDQALVVLHSPDEYSDEEVYQALVQFGGKLPGASAAVQKKGLEGIHLFCECWRMGMQMYSKYGKNLFELCFGARQLYPWHPLGNAVYDTKPSITPVTCELSPCRQYVYDGVRWTEQCYHELNFNKDRLNGLLREADRKLREYLKVGRALQARKEEAWADLFIDAVIEKDKAEKQEALRPKVTISFSDLDKIRTDALETRDRLLTEEDVDNAVDVPVPVIPVVRQQISVPEIPAVCAVEPAESPEPAVLPGIAEIAEALETVSNSMPSEAGPGVPLDDFQKQIFGMLLRGESVRDIIRTHHGLPEVIADTLNDIMYDEIGDTVVECDGDSIVLVDDYRDDVMRILGNL